MREANPDSDQSVRVEQEGEKEEDVDAQTRREDDEEADEEQETRQQKYLGENMMNRKMLMKIRKNQAEGDELTGEEASVSSSEQYTRFSSNQVDSSGRPSLRLVFPSSSSNDRTAEALLSLFPSSSLPGSSMDQSQDPWEVTQFTHEEVVNGVIGYFVGEETLSLFQVFSESILDEMDMTVSAAGVQPGNFKLSFMIMRVPVIMTPSSPVNDNNHSASTTSDPSSSKSNDSPTKKKPTVTNSSFDQGVNYLSIMITKDHLIASGLILFFCLASILILILMKAFNLFKIEDERQADEADASKTKGSSNATPVATTNVISRHDNFSCSSPSSPASSSFSRSHPHNRTQSECSCPCKEQYKSENVTQQLQGNSLQPAHSVNNTLRRSYRLNHRQSYPHVIPASDSHVKHI